MPNTPKIEKNVESPKSATARATMIGAVIAAIAASACCVLPAILAVVGISGASLGAALEAYRPLFLGGTAVLLGAGFYLMYRKPRPVADGGGDACECPAPRTRSTGKVMLWIAALAAVFFAAYPYIAGASATTQSRGDAVQTTESQTVSLHVDGMTCESCVPEIVEALTDVPGVVEARVEFDDAAAVVVYDAERVKPDALADAVTALDGYTAKVVTP